MDGSRTVFLFRDWCRDQCEIVPFWSVSLSLSLEERFNMYVASERNIQSRLE